ncbi:MAG: T9SS type A sorting domain-containing protein [Ferruginibacter sp.]
MIALFATLRGSGQANPSIAVLPANSGMVALGATLDLEITIGNTGLSNIPSFKLRPVITVPPIVNILPDAQQTGLPAGWSIITNTGSQIRICNGPDVIAGFSSRTIIIKVQGVAVGGPSTFAGQINFGNGISCAAAGGAVAGNNTADDFSTSTIQVVPGCALGVNATALPILCNGGTSTITATTTAATGPVEYSIDGAASFQPGNIFANVVAGNYTVIAREINNPLTCITSAAITVSEPAAVPSPLVNIVQPSCSIAEGIVTLTSSTTGLIFSVDGASFTAYPGSGYSLPAGLHTIVARNSNNCNSVTLSFTIDAQPVTPSAPIVGSVIQPDCSIATGSVTLSNLPSGNWTIQPGTVSGNTGSTTLSNLAPGSYSFTVTNTAGCTSAAVATVTINTVPGAPDAPSVNISQPTCTVPTGSAVITSAVTNFTFSLDGAVYGSYPSGGYNGLTPGTHTLTAQNTAGCFSPVTSFSINVQPVSPPAPTVNVEHPTCTTATGIITVTSSTTGFSFSLDGGAFAAYPAGGYIVNAGNHSIAVQNSSGCAPNTTGNIIINNQPATPVVSTAFTSISCFGGTSEITVTAAGAVTPYEYSLNAAPYQASNIFTVPAGNYNINVRDANGCIGSSNNLQVTQPAAITASATALPIPCNGGNTTLTITATGGNGTYEYSLNNGVYQSSNTFIVTAGTHNFNVRLAANHACSVQGNTVINITQPAILHASATANAIPYCGGNTTVIVTANGGTLPYTGTGNFIKGPGNWDMVVQDANGCSTTSEVMILPPGCVDLKVFPNPTQNKITINHSAAVGNASYLQVFAANGSRVMTQLIPQNGFSTTLDVSGLAAGMYTLLYLNGDERKETKFLKINQ